MSDAARLLTAEELQAIRGRLEKARGAEGGVLPTVESTQRVLTDDWWYADTANFLAHSVDDIPALLHHIDLLTGLIGDMAADEGTGAVLRMRRALEEVAARTERVEPIKWLASIAREALQGPK